MTTKIIDLTAEETTSPPEVITARMNVCMLCNNLALGEYPQCSQNQEAIIVMSKLITNQCPVGNWS